MKYKIPQNPVHQELEDSHRRIEQLKENDIFTILNLLRIEITPTLTSQVKKLASENKEKRNGRSSQSPLSKL